MTTHKIQSLLIAIFSVLCLLAVGVSIAERSALFAVIFLLAAILLVGFGFMLKGKRRKNGTL
ncbi:DUF5325 family protein [Aneurinibacillus tyrosinisolvens]|jgi:hypothetical protein|uniref:DUF5325 family protein n=1 Tax=Aneurinibacillus tyrosinisolvens TaxID=1443435 RepID=UPI00063EEFEA|nr:DUF5325 family protein [Aneurinibacillus tyrosinisolvens]